MPRQTLISHYPPTRRRLSDRARLVRIKPPRSALRAEHPELIQDLRMARELQQGLLLQSLPQLRGWEIAAVSLPASEIGGDLYDFVPLSPTIQGIMIGDVSGHGLAAALRMAVARTLFRQYARLGEGPAATLGALNRALIRELPTGMVTMLYAQANLQTGELRIANAGHTFPIMIANDVVESEVAGLPLGIDSDEQYAEITATVAPGDTIMLYTDGITEADDARGRMYGYGRLESLLRRYHRQRPRTLLGNIVSTVKQWSENNLDDDVTALLIRRRLHNFNSELRSVCVDVLGEMGAAALWVEVAGTAPTPDAWQAQLAQIGRTVQARHGRGLSRELVQQLRVTLDEYRQTQAGLAQSL